MTSLDLNAFGRVCIESSRSFRSPHLSGPLDVEVFDYDDEEAYKVRVRAMVPSRGARGHPKLLSVDELVPKSEATAAEGHAVVQRLAHQLVQRALERS